MTKNQEQQFKKYVFKIEENVKDIENIIPVGSMKEINKLCKNLKELEQEFFNFFKEQIK